MSLPFTFGPSEPSLAGGKKFAASPQPAEIMTPPDADRLLLLRYAPPAVVVNDRLEILQVKGDVASSLALRQADRGVNLLEAVQPALLEDLQSAIAEVRNSGREIRRENSPIRVGGASQGGALCVIPLPVSCPNERNLMIVFEGAGEWPAQAPPTGAPSDISQNEFVGQVEHLRLEMMETKKRLESVIASQRSMAKELELAHQEILSGNEQLQIANDNLRAAREELEATNHELETFSTSIPNRSPSKETERP